MIGWYIRDRDPRVHKYDHDMSVHVFERDPQVYVYDHVYDNGLRVIRRCMNHVLQGCIRPRSAGVYDHDPQVYETLICRCIQP
jgi:hypothetical protein